MALHPPGEGQAAILIQHTKARHTGGQNTVTDMDTTMGMGIRTNRAEFVRNRLKPRLRHPVQNQQGSKIFLKIRG